MNEVFVLSKNPKLVVQLRELSMRERYLASTSTSSNFFSFLFSANKVGPKAAKSAFDIIPCEGVQEIPEESLILADAESIILPNGRLARPKEDCVLIVIVQDSEAAKQFVAKYRFREDDVITVADTEREEILSALAMKQTMRNLRA